MADVAKESLLKKHIAPPRPVKAAGAGAVEKVLAVALPRSADQLLGLQVGIQSVSFGTLDQPGVLAALTECDLICRMSRACSGPGLIVVDPSLLSGLIEVQTLGKVTGSPPKERSPTRTDATVVSDLLDRWMTDASAAVSEQGLAQELLTDGYLRSDGILGLRAGDLTLDPGQYRSLVVKMALGEEGKVGTLSFFAPKSAVPSGNEASGTLGRQLWAHLLDAPVEMMAVLTRASRSLDEIMVLKAGEFSLCRPNNCNRLNLRPMTEP
jgi:flagellar motor switch protein FliM